MAKTAFLRRCLPGVAATALFILAGLAVVCPVKAAVDDQLAESIRSNEAGQTQVQTQAQELAAQLRAMSAEFERNGLKGDEVKTLNLISASIGTMSEQDMTRIIGLLRQARTLGDQAGVLQHIAAAYSGQKNVTTQLKGLLALYQKDQAAANVAAALTKLAERQAANLQTGITVAQWSPGKKADDAQTDLKAALEVQSSEQMALRDEAKQAATKLQATAKDASDPAAAAKVQAALQKFNQLNAVLDQATTDLKEGHVFKALSSEKQARDSLRQLARDLAPQRESLADALRQTDKEMTAMIAQQKEMIAQTTKIKETPADIVKWTANQLKDPKSEVSKTVTRENMQGASPEQLAEDDKIKAQFHAKVTVPNEERLASLEPKANDLANRSDTMSQDLQKDAAQAAASVKAAQEKMQDARTDLDEHNAASALTNQQTALAQMEQAQKQVQAQIAAQDAAQNADRMTQLQAAKQQAQQLAAQQNAATEQQTAQPQAGANNAAQESDLKNKAQALQAKIEQAQAPAAAASVQQAAAQMQKAADALKQPTGQAQAQAAEAAATAALQRANAQLDKEIAQTAAAQQEQQQVDQALAVLEKIIAGQEKVQADTTLASAPPAAAAKPATADKKAAKTPAAAPIPSGTEIAVRQAGLKTDTAVLAKTLATPDVAPAVEPLNGAQSQMETSRTALAASTPAAALGAQRFAMNDLLKAKELLSAKKTKLDQLTNPAAAQAAQDRQQAQLTNQIAQAQAQAAAAQSRLAQAQPQQAQQNQAQQSQSQQARQSQSQPGQSHQGQSQQGQPQQGQQNGAQTAQTQNAQQNLDQAANTTGQAAANAAAGQMPDALRQALADAQQALNQAANAAAQGNQSAAQAETAQAQQALAQAQSQAEAAQAGLAQAGENGATPPGAQPAGGQPGSQQAGQQSGQQANQPGQPSGPQTAANSNQPTEEGAEAQGPGNAGQRDPGKIGQGSLEKGARGAGKQGSAFAALPPRDRAALQQSQTEKYPQEYGAMIEQYMQSLADQPGS